MNEQLLLSNVRAMLRRLEETIIFALIERAQFCCNAIVYRAGAFPEATGHESLVGLLLYESECSHARLRRYTSPDEHPYFADLPAPVLPALNFSENPLMANTINVNDQIRRIYEQEIVPHICVAGDDRQYGSSAVCDVACLQALSKRIHYGKFVAESKYRSSPELFEPAIAAGDASALWELITHAEVEAAVLARVHDKAQTYGRDLDGNPGQTKINADVVVDIYRKWIIPLNKDVQVAYLLQRRGRTADTGVEQ